MIDIIISILARGAELFYAPLLNVELLWVVIPVYIQWFLTSTYQERKETRFGNALVNGFICTWVGLDWSKELYQEIVSGTSTIELFRLVLSIILIIYGVFIIIEAFRGKRIVKYIGRIREISYFIIVLTPVFYGVVPLDSFTVVAIIAIFPISYAISGLITRYVPYPGESSEEEPETEEPEPIPDEEPFTPEPDEPPSLNEPTQTQNYTCPSCGSPLSYVQQYGKYFCRRCNRYV